MTRGPKGKREHDGVLKGHYKSGRIYKPELLAYPETTPNDWFRDDLPDLLWPLLLVAVRGREGAAAMSRFQQRVVALVETKELDNEDVQLDGRLTSLEACSPAARKTILALLEDEETRKNVIPPELVGVLRMYTDVPGSWLLVEPWADLDGVPDFDTASAVLTEAVIGVLEDRHLNAVTKATPFGWLLLSGKMHFAGDQGEVLINYPMDEAKRGHADAFILSSFLAFKAMTSSELVAAADRWARSFWAQNWERFPCLVQDDDEGDDGQEEDVSTESTRSRGEEVAGTVTEDAAPDPVTGSVIGALSTIDDVYDGFLRVALDRNQEINLHSPARHEVLCGLVARAYRAAIAIVRAPHLWTGEHASGTQRVFSETAIVIRWLLEHGDEAFERYQAYGRGRRKLMRKHTEALVQSFGEDVPDFVKALADGLEEKTGGGWQEEFQEVSLESTFAGISLRQMAEEVDALDEYRHVIQPASGVLHGEWWVLEDYAMERCYQILHRGHWLPVTTPEGGCTLEFAALMVSRFDGIATLALSGLRTDGGAPEARTV